MVRKESGCAGCKFLELCKALGYETDCADEGDCEHYDAYLEGQEIAEMGEI